jgi:hypothetical protein
MISLIFLIYFIGCLLSYPRIYASFYEIDESYIHNLPPDNFNIIRSLMMSILSWLSVVAGIMLFFSYPNKYFWKWNNKDLWLTWQKLNLK